MGSGSSGLQVVILAAGKGVRMRSELPKVLHKLCGQSLVERALRAVCGLKPGRVVVVVGFKAELVRAEVSRLNATGAFGEAEVLCVDQVEQHGTGHATQIAFAQLDPNLPHVMVLPGDAPLVDASMLGDFFDYYNQVQADLSLLSCCPPDAASFGRVVRSNANEVVAIVERKDCSSEQVKISEINSSIYLGNYNFLSQALPMLKNDNAQGEYYLTDIVGFGSGLGKKVTAFCSDRWQNLVGANSRAELSALEKIRRREICLAWMDVGVTFEDPDSVYIDELVELNGDTFIGAGTRLR
ncbi:MAG: NTP transferase domain-containing protein, partial [Dokdonella sp.]